MSAEVDHLLDEIDRLRDEIDRLRAENEGLRHELANALQRAEGLEYLLREDG